MDFFVICTTALVASLLTLFSGFGLGTLLMPVVAIFFPLEIAITITAMVHLANNLFKFSLFGKHAEWSVVWRFGIPAIVFAIGGALVLQWLSDLPAVYQYQIGGQAYQVLPIKLIIGCLILTFIFAESRIKNAGYQLDKKYLPLGGMISGFFGGLSGHQGAFRSMFLIKLGLSKQAFVATGVVLAVIIDLSRLGVYSQHILATTEAVDWGLVIAATVSAFVGAILGKQLLKKVTIDAVHLMVSLMLTLVSLGLITGLL